MFIADWVKAENNSVLFWFCRDCVSTFFSVRIVNFIYGLGKNRRTSRFDEQREACRKTSVADGRDAGAARRRSLKRFARQRGDGRNA